MKRRMFPKWIRRIGFRLAFSGCMVDDKASLEYAKRISESGSREAQNAIQDALQLRYFAKQLQE